MVMKEMCFDQSLEDCQGFSIADGDVKIVPPARNGE